MVKPICSEPFKAAFNGDSPRSRYLEIFSITTMASSTTKPVAMVRAMSVKLLILKPARYITAKVPTKDNGTATLGIKVAGIFRKNKKMTIITSAMANRSSIFTSSIEALMVIVRSVKGITSTLTGKVACNLGNKALMLSTTSITFAPGWR